MDIEDQLPQPVRFLSRDLTSKSVLRAARFAFVASLFVMGIGVVSVGFGVVVDMYLYAALCNVVPLLFPLVLYEAMAQRRWSGRILKVQGWFGVGVAVGAIVADCVILGYLGTVYNLCYGERNSNCESKGHNKYTCSAILPGMTTTDIDCESRITQIFGLFCVIANLIAFLLCFGYLYLCRRLKSALSRVEAEGRRRVEEIPEATVVSIIGREVVGEEVESRLEMAYPRPCSVEPCPSPSRLHPSTLYPASS